MSFILDALKKSENERQKARGPALFEVKVAPPASRFPLWAVIVGVLLGVNLVVLIAVLLLRDKQDPAVQATQAQIALPSPAVPTAAAASPVPATPAALPVPAAPAAPSVAPEAVTRYNPPLVEEDPSLLDEPLTSARGAPINPADYQPATSGPARAPGSAQTSGVPSRDDLIAAGKGGIPEANVSLHVYDKNPAARFVFVNGQRAKEGDVLANGIRVDEIRADGAVLSYAGSRFLVPIQ